MISSENCVHPTYILIFILEVVLGVVHRGSLVVHPAQADPHILVVVLGVVGLGSLEAAEAQADPHILAAVRVVGSREGTEVGLEGGSLGVGGSDRRAAEPHLGTPDEPPAAPTTDPNSARRE